MKKIFIITLLIISISMPVMANGFGDFLMEQAEQGDANAQYMVGQFAPNYEEVLKWWHKSAEQGYAPAQFSLGRMYYLGKGVTQDYKEAVKWWRKSAKQSDADAQFGLGIMYYNGDGVIQDYKEAIKWYQKSAEQDNANAQYHLGRTYITGKGVTRSAKEADKWYRKSAEQGHASAQFSLGLSLHLSGDNNSKAYALYLLAKTNGVDKASGYIKGVSKEMTTAQIEQAQALASKCHESNYKNCDGLFDE